MTAPPKAAPRPQAQPDKTSHWRHTPQVAAVNTMLVGIPAAAAWRLLGLAPGIGLAFAAVLAVALAYSGQARRPRRLAMRSILYRVFSMLGVGIWFWAVTADFSAVRGLSTIGITCAGITVLAVLTAIIALRFHHGQVALGALGIGLLATALSIPFIADTNVLSVLFETAELRHGWANFGHWLIPSSLWLAGFAVPMAVIGVTCASHEADMDETMNRALTVKAHGREMQQMQEILAQELRQSTLRVVDFDAWDNAAGENYVLDAADAGVTPDDINRARDRIAARLRLKNGCGVEAIQGVDRGQIILAVSKVDKIRDDQPFPEGVEQRTIYNGIPIGVYRDGNQVHIRLRESSVFLWGQKRSGKTSTLYEIIAMLCQCTDTMIWVIDLGGGGVALPFLYPYAEGKTDRPVIDWVATTVDEAKLMVDFAYEIAVFRKQFYKHKKRKAKLTLLPLDAELPQIIIVIDEGAEIMGQNPTMTYEAKEVRSQLEQIVRVAGDSGVNVIFSGLAATQEVIDRMIKEQLAIRIGMRCTSSAELAYGFDGEYGLNPADVPYQGSGFVKPSHEEGIRVFKAFKIEVEEMEEIATVTADWRPEMDEPSASLPAHAKIYKERWVRTQHLLQDEDGNLLVDVAAHGRPAVAVADRPAAPTSDAPAPPAGGGGGDGIDWASAGGQALPPPGAEDPGDRPIGRAADDADETVIEFQRQLERLDSSNPEAWSALLKDTAAVASPAPAASPQGILEALVKFHGPNGIRFRDLTQLYAAGGAWGQGVAVTDVTLHNWLKEAGETWLSRRDRKKDRGKPYVHDDFAN